MKLASVWALIAVLEWYYMSNSLSFIAHKMSRLATSRLFMIFRRGLSVWNTIVYAWKYVLSLRATVIKAKANFPMEGYLSFGPLSARLV